MLSPMKLLKFSWGTWALKQEDQRFWLWWADKGEELEPVDNFPTEAEAMAFIESEHTGVRNWDGRYHPEGITWKRKWEAA